MFNLLPVEDKKVIRSEYCQRLISIALGVSLFILTATLLLLVPLLINVHSANNNTKVELNALKSKPASNNYRDFESIIKNTKKAIDILKVNLSGRKHIANVITEALDNKPKGVSVESIYWIDNEFGVKLNVNGVASSRESLRKYVSILQSNKSFSGVDIPVSDFAKAEEAEFSITLKVSKGNK